MALINTLRNKMGKLLVAVVAVAILSFILADFLGQGSFTGDDREVGEIAGNDISLEEYQAKVQEIENQYILSTNRQPGEREMISIRNSAWDALIAEHAVEKQYKKVGMQVTPEELWDRVQGRNIDPGIQQSFTNPETGSFDRQMFLQYLQSLPQQPAQVQVQWDLYKQNLKPARERVKYENLMLKTDYVTDAEAVREYRAQNTVADVEYLYVPFYAISDTAVNVTESAIKEYYKKNKENYKTEATRSVKYVTFPVVPTSQDTAVVMEELQDILTDFKTTTNDSLYASALSDGINPYTTYVPGTLPPSLQSVLDTISEGDVVGPFIQDGVYKIIKLSEAGEDTLNYARASHILFKWDEDTPEAKREARNQARKVLRELKEGASFSAMAMEYGQDATRNRGGDLGWFKTRDMVEEFERAVFNARREGLLNDLVETEYGYHIIRVDELPQNNTYTVASIEREVIAGTDTENEAYRAADIFTSRVSSVKEFENQALQDTLQVNTVEDIQKNDRRIGRLGEARNIVQWLFRDAEVGDVSEVFNVDGAYVVVAVTDEVEEGYKPLEAVKGEIRAKVKNRLKGEAIVEQLQKIDGSLEDIASEFGEEANIYSMSDLKLSSNSLTGVGFDPLAVGKAFSLSDGERTEPFIGENGVLIIKLNNKTEAPEIADYQIYKQQLRQRTSGRTANNIVEAIKNNADIKDERYKFY
jgi:peptidyl-prolyl cis-trans isomerase D